MKNSLLVSLIALMTSSTLAYSYEVTEYEVISGDTIKISGGNSPYKISCIEAPYSDQPYFLESKDRLIKILSAGEINAESYSENGRNPSGILYVDGRNICYEMLRGGFAWANSKTDRGKVDWGVEGVQDNFLQVEREARQKKVGLFAYANPQPPWQSKKLIKDTMASSVPIEEFSSENISSYDDVSESCKKAIQEYKEKSEWLSFNSGKNSSEKLINNAIKLTELSPYKLAMNAACGTIDKKPETVTHASQLFQSGKGAVDSSGIYYNPTEGGYINSKTGEFIPGKK